MKVMKILVLCFGLWGCVTVNNPPGSSASSTSGGAGPDSGAQLTTSSSSSSGGTSSGTSSDAAASTTTSYVATCLLAIANGQTSHVISFWAYFVSSNDGSLIVSLQPMALVNSAPPTIASRANLVGVPFELQGTAQPNEGINVMASQGLTMTIPAAANPISGTDLSIASQADALIRVQGAGGGIRLCGRLSGHVTQPVAASGDLDPDLNSCVFSPIQEGGSIPPSNVSDYSAGQCPK